MGEVKFEESMESLKEVVSKLEREDISLDEAIELYKKGIELSKECREKLESAEKLVKTVIDENGNEGELSEDY
ncbi:MAG: exodeoxyribonuclease VII small subunit [Bacilli bacterium]